MTRGDKAEPGMKVLMAVLSLVVAVGAWAAGPSGLAVARVVLATWGVGVVVHQEWVDREN